jgi:hypothetical protein
MFVLYYVIQSYIVYECLSAFLHLFIIMFFHHHQVHLNFLKFIWIYIFLWPLSLQVFMYMYL